MVSRFELSIPCLIVIVSLPFRECNFPIQLRQWCQMQIGVFPFGVHPGGFPCFLFDFFGVQHHRGFEHDFPFSKLRKDLQTRIWDPGVSNHKTDHGGLCPWPSHIYGNLIVFVLEIGTLVPPSLKTPMILYTDFGTGRILVTKKIQFLFQSEEEMSSIIRRGPWSFIDGMCVLQKWIQFYTAEDLKKILFWAQARDVSLHFLTLQMVSQIGHRPGHFLETVFGRDGGSLVDYVRVCLLYRIDVPLRFQRIFQFGDEACVLTIRHEKLRYRELLLPFKIRDINLGFEHVMAISLSDQLDTKTRKFVLSYSHLVVIVLNKNSFSEASDLCLRRVVWSLHKEMFSTHTVCISGRTQMEMEIAISLDSTGKRTMDINEQQWVERYRRHDQESFQATYQSIFSIKVMRKAFRSFIYKMIACYKCMKRGLNRFILLPVRLLLESRVTSTSSSKLGFNFLYLFQRLYLKFSCIMYHVNFL